MSSHQSNNFSIDDKKSSGEVGEDSTKKRLNSKHKRDETSKKGKSSKKGAKSSKDNGNKINNTTTTNEEAMDDTTLDNTPKKSDKGQSDNHSSNSGNDSESRNSDEGSKQKKRKKDPVWDLETAIQYLSQMGSVDNTETNNETNNDNSSSNNNTTSSKSQSEETPDENGDDSKRHRPTETDKDVEAMERDHTCPTSEAKPEKTKDSPSTKNGGSYVKEYLTQEESSWITFRAAHAGDASTIALWYRKQRSENRRRKKNSAKSTTARDQNHEIPNHGDREEPEIDKEPLRPSSSNEDEANNNSSDNDNGNERSPNKSNDTGSDVSGPQNDGGSDGNEVDQETQTEEDETTSSSLQLEHWLAEGLGDENTCPFVHGLLAYIHRSPKKKHEKPKISDDDDKTMDSPLEATLSSAKAPPSVDTTNGTDETDDDGHFRTDLAAVVLMSLCWISGKRNLRIEWMSYDDSFVNREGGWALRQKVWLRIHTLSSMTACEAISIDDDVLESAAADEPPPKETPNEEDDGDNKKESIEREGDKKPAPKENQPVQSQKAEPSAE